MDLQLHGRTALITGAASGIGRATALALAAEGMRVALLDRDAEALEEVAAACAAVGAGAGAGAGAAGASAGAGAGSGASAVGDAGGAMRAVPVVADVTSEEQVSRAVGDAVRELGGLDALVCCAGISGPVGQSIDALSLDDWNAVLAVNVTGAFLVVREALPALRAASAASVVLLASDSASVASQGMVPYCASKAALVQFGRALSVDLAGTGVRVNSVAPSVVDTPMSRSDLGADAFSDASFPVQSADEVAAHVAYLVSPRSRAVNGTSLLSDFGYSARSGFPA
ncbi:SDR family NAD(P)-dependent oxidoreductase [Microbacterium sp. 3J1]|uniref:SDR family NAD(P)-dependent oxidoreductase n=1 Tax=Microbacterium sp. 3J1 TaxID=861269 RepID=UPI000B8700F5|nr:SDR family oxidoreductase [Microbacterium sp. 3J1]